METNIYVSYFVLFSLASSTVILNSSRRLALLAVCFGVLAETCVAQACNRLPWSIQDMFTFE